MTYLNTPAKKNNNFSSLTPLGFSKITETQPVVSAPVTASNINVKTALTYPDKNNNDQLTGIFYALLFLIALIYFIGLIILKYYYKLSINRETTAKINLITSLFLIILVIIYFLIGPEIRDNSPEGIIGREILILCLSCLCYALQASFKNDKFQHKTKVSSILFIILTVANILHFTIINK